MIRKSFLPLALVAAFTVAGGCSKDKTTSTEPTGSTLTTAETADLTAAMQALGAFAWSPAGLGTQPAMPAGLAAQQSGSFPYHYTVNCPGGGNWNAQGTVSYSLSGSTYTYSGNVTQAYSNCRGNGRGSAFAFTGSPTQSVNVTYNLSTGAYAMTLHNTGNFNWTNASKSGSCALNINASVNLNTASSTYSGSYSGTVCGQSISTTTF